MKREKGESGHRANIPYFLGPCPDLVLSLLMEVDFRMLLLAYKVISCLIYLL